jgi:methylmalonyl-CoA/ethylmalonyl-CoA epimerase
MFSKIRAIHLAVNDVDSAKKVYADNFGIVASGAETLPALGIKNALLPVGDAVIELIEPLDHEQGPLAKFLKKRGEGVYMVALEVENMDSTIKDLKEKGVRLMNDDPESRAGGVPVFIHPKSASGLLIELVEMK